MKISSGAEPRDPRRLNVQEGQIRADAVVRHVKPGGGLGLKFQAVSEKDRPNLAALMKRLRGMP